MIKFFRKIRQSLLSQNNFSKYLLYAFGEIVLVVLGILIALQINNSNEHKKEIKNTDLQLKEVYSELVSNIVKSEELIEYYRVNNEHSYKILNKQLTPEDYRSNVEIAFILSGYSWAEISTIALDNLVNTTNNYTIEQDSIISGLKELYANDKENVDLGNKISESNYLDFRQELMKTKPWFGNYRLKGQLSDEAIDYFLNDPFYYNRVVNYTTQNLGDHLSSTISFWINAKNNYSRLTNYLQHPIDSSIVKNIENYDHYLGRYDLEDQPVYGEIEKTGNEILLNLKTKTDSSIVMTLKIFPNSATNCIIEQPQVTRGFGEFEIEENGQVSSLTLLVENQKEVIKKIK